jgi:hypothetical protein
VGAGRLNLTDYAEIKAWLQFMNYHVGVANSGGNGVVAGERFVDLLRGDGAFAADAPEVAAEFDDGGRRDAIGAAGVEDQREAITELAEDFVAGFAGRRAGKIGAGAGERNADFGDEVADNSILGPAKSDAARVAGDFQREAVGSVDNQSERAGPAGLRQTIEIIGKVPGEGLGKGDGVDEDRKSALLGASFDAKNLFDRGEIDRIGGQSVERVGWHSDDRTAIEPVSRVANDPWIGIRGTDLQYLSRQSKVPTLFWSGGQKPTRR